ncbi:helix-turn-helix domain-containing protein [Kitasatospora sp. NPDC008115]|uniref:helix-turn-helix domain-containing protein n=1 Tax=Kitasatospora sp. NPDC008115 TaxID=3364022 RepID=UPI0036E5376B
MSGFAEYDNDDDFLSEFYDDPADIARIKAGADRLVQESRAARLAELRERAEVSREQVAERMGVGVDHVLAVEAGEAWSGADLAGYIGAIGGTVDFMLVDADGIRHVVEARCSTATVGAEVRSFHLAAHGLDTDPTRASDVSPGSIPQASEPERAGADASFELWLLLHSWVAPTRAPGDLRVRYSPRTVLHDLASKRKLQVEPVGLEVVAEVDGLRAEVA